MIKQALKKRIFALGSLFFILGLCFGSWASRIPDIQEKFNLSEGDLGYLLLCLPLGALLGLPIAGGLVHRYGSKFVILSGGVCYAMNLCLLGWSSSIGLLASSLFFFGFFGNVMNIAVNTQAIVLEDDCRENMIASFHGLWSAAGFVAGGIGAGMIALTLAPHIHFTVILILSFMVIVISRPFIISEKRSTKSGGFVLKKPDVLLLRLGAISFLGMMCEGCMFDWSGVYFNKVINANPNWVIVGYVVFMGAMSSGRFIADSVAKKIGKLTLIRLSGFLIFTGLLIAVVIPNFWVTTVSFMLVGFGVAAIVPMAYSIAGRSKIYSPSVALALVSTIAFFGFLLGPPLIGFIADLSSLRVSFILISLNGLGIIFLSTYRDSIFGTQSKNIIAHG